MYNVSFTGVKCETLGPCYSEPCDENNTESNCKEINNLTDYTCTCKTGRSHLFHFTPSLKFSGLCGFLMASHAKVLLYTGLFSPCVIFTLLHLQTVSPHLEFAKTQLCLKRIKDI